MRRGAVGTRREEAASAGDVAAQPFAFAETSGPEEAAAGAAGARVEPMAQKETLTERALGLLRGLRSRRRAPEGPPPILEGQAEPIAEPPGGSAQPSESPAGDSGWR
ncbi:MAG: hypothetical protein HY702_03100 [Gemmatimonadetes bacterium]|nr:hypothetical protein [Gemmatimonadota bacterium]